MYFKQQPGHVLIEGVIHSADLCGFNGEGMKGRGNIQYSLGELYALPREKNHKRSIFSQKTVKLGRNQGYCFTVSLGANICSRIRCFLPFGPNITFVLHF